MSTKEKAEIIKRAHYLSMTPSEYARQCMLNTREIADRINMKKFKEWLFDIRQNSSH